MLRQIAHLRSTHRALRGLMYSSLSSTLELPPILAVHLTVRNYSRAWAEEVPPHFPPCPGRIRPDSLSRMMPGMPTFTDLTLARLVARPLTAQLQPVKSH